MAGCASPGALPGAQAVAQFGAARSVPASADSARAVSPIVLTPPKLALFGTGAATAEKVLASERGYAGKLFVTNECAKVATVTPASGGNPLTVTVTAIKGGKCSIVFSDARHHKAVLSVTDKPGGQLSFPLIIPTRLGRDKAHRLGGARPFWTSPSSQAMMLTITGPQKLSLVSGLTAVTPGCQVTVNGLQCTISADLTGCPETKSGASDCYTATIVTYDAYDASNNTIPPSAVPLSIAQGKFSIENDRSTSTAFNFSGIPARVTVLPGSALSNATGNVIDLVGPGAHPMYAQAYDADDNVISGDGGPSFTVSASGHLALQLTQPPPGSPRFTVTPPSTLQGPLTLATLTATAKFPTGEGVTDGCAVQGAVCSGAVTMDMQSLLAVTSGFSVNLYAAEKGIGPLLTITSGINSSTRSVALDANGDLYVATSGAPSIASTNGSVVEFAPGATLPVRTITSGVDSPLKILTDSANDLWVLNGAGQSVTEYSSQPSDRTPIATFATPAHPTVFAADASRDVWVASEVSGQAWFFKQGAATPSAISGLVRPVGMALDPATNTLYVADQTYAPISNQAGCGSGAASTFCKIYTYAYPSQPGTLNPSTYSSASYGGDLAWLPGFGLFADNATGPRLAFYDVSSAPPVVPSAWTGGLNAGEAGGLAVDELGNLFVAAPYNGTVYGYLFVSFFADGPSGTTAPNVAITNGLTFPYNLAIVP